MVMGNTGLEGLMPSTQTVEEVDFTKPVASTPEPDDDFSSVSAPSSGEAKWDLDAEPVGAAGSKPEPDMDIDRTIAFADAKPTTAPISADASQASSKPRLEIRLGKFAATYELKSPQTVIGRPDPNSGATPDIAIEWDDAISRRHAQVLVKGSEYFLEDLGSKNGTFMSGKQVEPGMPVSLVSGDMFIVGEHTEVQFFI
jgi:hypothetical protein